MEEEKQKGKREKWEKRENRTKKQVNIKQE